MAAAVVLSGGVGVTLVLRTGEAGEALLSVSTNGGAFATKTLSPAELAELVAWAKKAEASAKAGG